MSSEDGSQFDGNEGDDWNFWFHFKVQKGTKDFALRVERSGSTRRWPDRGRCRGMMGCEMCSELNMRPKTVKARASLLSFSWGNLSHLHSGPQIIK